MIRVIVASKAFAAEEARMKIAKRIALALTANEAPWLIDELPSRLAEMLVEYLPEEAREAPGSSPQERRRFSRRIAPYVQDVLAEVFSRDDMGYVATNPSDPNDKIRIDEREYLGLVDLAVKEALARLSR